MAYRVQRVVNQGLQVRVALIRIALLDALHSGIKRTPAHSLFQITNPIPSPAPLPGLQQQPQTNQGSQFPISRSAR